MLLGWLGVVPVQVVHRKTGEAIEEKTPNSVMLQLAILHTTWIGNRMATTPAIRKHLERLTTRKGEEYDRPNSQAQISAFIEEYDVDLDTVPLPLSGYATLNEFFFRAHSPSARPIFRSGDATALVQPCDCRLMVFDSWIIAQQLWVKGHGFSLPRLLGDAYSAAWDACAVVLSRLAPGDHHRFYVPCAGRIANMTLLQGAHYSVKPIVVNSSLDVFGHNRRFVVELDETPVGRVIMVIVGAAAVGSIRFSAQVGDRLAKGQELGLFAYGGSTVVTLFQQGTAELDQDLLERSATGVETLVQLGSSLGHVCRRRRSLERSEE